jgi:hypothetical protein
VARQASYKARYLNLINVPFRTAKGHDYMVIDFEFNWHIVIPLGVVMIVERGYGDKRLISVQAILSLPKSIRR